MITIKCDACGEVIANDEGVKNMKETGKFLHDYCKKTKEEYEGFGWYKPEPNFEIL